MGKNPRDDDFGLEGKKFWGKLNTSLGDMHFMGRIETLQGNYLAYYDNIAQVIRNDADLIVKPEQSLEVIRIIRAAIESNEKGVRVEFH
jgi:predicted dehydrogenase